MIQFANNFQALLTSSISATDTILPLTTTSGLPVLTAASPLYLTLETADRLVQEVVRVEDVNGNDLTVVRGQDGTTGFAFPVGSYAEVRLPRIALQEFVQKNGDQTINGDMAATTFTEGGTLLSSKYLGISAKAADSDLLDGNDSSYFINTAGGQTITGDLAASTFTEGGTLLSSKYLGISAKAADSDLLDGNDSSYFINTAGGQTINGGLTLTGTLIPSVSVRIKGNGVGDANGSWIGFYESDGTTRQSYVGSGSGSDSDLHLYTDLPSTGVRIATRDSAGTSRLAAKFDGAAQACYLYHTGSEKFRTQSTGTYTTGSMVATGAVGHASYHNHYDYDDGYGSANYIRSYLRDGIYYTYGAGNAVDWKHALQKGSLHVGYGKISGNTYLIIEADSDNNNEADHPILEFKQDGGAVKWHIRPGGASGNALIVRPVSGTETRVEFRNQADTAYTARIDCETGNYESSGDITISGSGTGADWIATSDRRIKSNIERIDRALQRLSAVTGCTFNKDGADHRMAGVIAQDVEEALPEAVVDGKVKAVSAQAMIGLLVEAVKELEQRVEALQ